MNDIRSDHGISGEILELACTIGRSTKELVQELKIDRDERKSLSRIEHKLTGLQNTLDTFMAKISELEGSLTEVKTKVTKAFAEIRAKIDELNAKIEELTNGQGDAEIPAGAQTVVDELKALGQQLDDIVPDVPV